MADGKSRPPAETSAEYSPRLWPATKSGVMPCLARVRNAATDTARMAGCVLAVSFSSSSVPSQHILKSSKPTAASASSKTPLASGKLSARSRPMPGYCEAWPGNKNASLPIVFFAVRLVQLQHRELQRLKPHVKGLPAAGLKPRPTKITLRRDKNHSTSIQHFNTGAQKSPGADSDSECFRVSGSYCGG